MNKKILIAIGAVFGLFMLLAVAAVILGGGSGGEIQPTTQNTATVEENAQPDASAWNDYKVHNYGAEFFSKGRGSLAVESATFSSPEQPYTSVKVSLIAGLTEGGGRPPWLNNVSLVYRSGAAVKAVPGLQKAVISSSAGSFAIGIGAKNVRYDRIDPSGVSSSQSPVNEQPSKLYLKVTNFYSKKPGKGDLYVGIVAPAPPAGHEFGEITPDAPKVSAKAKAAKKKAAKRRAAKKKAQNNKKSGKKKG